MNFSLEAFEENEKQFQQEINLAIDGISSDDDTDPLKYDADLIISQEDDHMMKTLTNFKCQEFLILFQVIEPYLENAYIGGRKSKLSIKTMFLIALCFCKHALSFVFLETQFGFNHSYLERIVFHTISICHHILFNFAVKWISQEENERDGILFEYFPFATCAIDGQYQKDC